MGCGRACPALGCQGIPCEPQPPEVGYQAQGSGDCIGDTQAAVGSWTLTITSISAAKGQAGTDNTFYSPHGTLIASMPGDPGDGGAGTAQFTVTF